MDPVLRFCETAYIQTQNLMPLLSNYENPYDFISRLVKRKELIRVPFEQIANLLYGSSYISFEWA